MSLDQQTGYLIDVADLRTESDVEQKVILPLLLGGNYLSIQQRHVRTKEYLSPTKIDKSAGKKHGYYPDYSIWEKAFPVMIVEAKAPDVDVLSGYREAAIYAHHLNKGFRNGINPCQLILAINGIDLAFGYWDAEPTFTAKVIDLAPGSAKLLELIECCGSAVISALAQKFLNEVKVGRAVRPFQLAGGQALLTAQKPLNTFAAELSPILQRYFSSTADSKNKDIYEKAYVDTKEATEFDRILESLLKDRITSKLNPLSQEILTTRSNEPKLTKAISGYEKDRPREGQLQLITGRVGAGKSLFIRRYKEVLQPGSERSDRYWSFIDFNTGPSDLRNAQTWLAESFLRSFVEENPNFDIYDGDNLERIFSVELNRQKGIYAKLANISTADAEKQKIQDLSNWKDDPLKLTLGLCRFIGGERRQTVIVVMDNVDKRDLEDQLDAFQLSLWFMKESRAFVVLQMRDETYERYKNQPPLDTFRTGIKFHIAPPRFMEVVRKRLELSLDYLVSNTESKLSYTLPNGLVISYPNSRLGEFLRALYTEIFHKKKNISHILQGLSGSDVRKALDMFVAILSSGHLSEAAIASNTIGAGSIYIPEYTIIKILMRTSYSFFHENSGFVKNIFTFENTWINPNNFILIEILYYLITNRRVRGQIGLEGYFTIEHLADTLQMQGFIRADILSASKHLIRSQLVEADHMNIDSLEFSDSIKINSAGFIHLRILSERIEYIYGVLSVTPIYDNDVAVRLGDYLNAESQRGNASGREMSGATQLFLNYLELQFQRLQSNFSNFGHENSGAAYVLGQLRRALFHYRNPTQRDSSPNLLDL